MAEQWGWRGASGASYGYWVVGIGTRLRPVTGNYIFAKRSLSGGWNAVYVGQGDLAVRTDLSRHFKGILIRSLGATHVHIRENASENERVIEKADVLDGNPEAFPPTGCNESVD